MLTITRLCKTNYQPRNMEIFPQQQHGAVRRPERVVHTTIHFGSLMSHNQCMCVRLRHHTGHDASTRGNAPCTTFVRPRADTIWAFQDEWVKINIHGLWWYMYIILCVVGLRMETWEDSRKWKALLVGY